MDAKKIVESAKEFVSEKVSSYLNPSPRKVENAKKRVEELKHELKEAERKAKMANEEWHEFKEDAQEKIHHNQEAIKKLKAKLSHNNNNEKTRDELEEQIAELEHKNRVLKNRIGNNDAAQKWESFKSTIKESVKDVNHAWRDLVKVNLG